MHDTHVYLEKETGIVWELIGIFGKQIHLANDNIELAKFTVRTDINVEEYFKENFIFLC